MNADLIPTVKAKPYLMQNQVQHYEWGTRNGKAFIARLLGIAPQPGVPYGELWMGAHPKAPSQVTVDGTDIALDQWIAAYPRELLGDVVIARFGPTLPFLFKVLSAGEALSIQAHPNKAQAQHLHGNDPTHYPDDNHKPEVAIALDALTALMGIKPYPQLVEMLQRYPELSGYIGTEVTSQIVRGLTSTSVKQRELTRSLLTTLVRRSVTDSQALAQSIDSLAERLTALSNRTEAEDLFLSLHDKYPGPDVGLYAIFLLNLVHLAEGEGMFAEAGVPHAYLYGNIVECMANSDNVVRIGLTPKFKDADALIEILKYEPGPVTILGNTPSEQIVVYSTPAPDFQVSRLRLPGGVHHSVTTGGKPQVLLVTKGAIVPRWRDGEETVQHGQSVFVPALLPDYTIQARQATELFLTAIPI